MYEIAYTTVADEPMAFVPVECKPGLPPYPEHYRDLLMVDVIHDGRVIPEEYLRDADDRRIPEEVFYEAYVRERDWGASIVAARLAQQLYLPGFYKVNTARVLLDFGRFPGSTALNAAHLQRYAINYPFSKLLGFTLKMRLLEEHYDRISSAMDAAVSGKLIKLAMHTYEQYNPAGTERPEVSLVTRSIGYQIDAEVPHGPHDPLYPDSLGEFTADRILRDRVSLTLEKNGIAVGHNYPYLLPEGSPEVRSQVWSFFQYLRRRFEAVHPETANLSEFQLVWQMLLDTNLRSSECDTLRSHLHMFRRAPRGRVREFARAQRAYQRMHTFLHEDEQQIVEGYRFSIQRHNSLGIEVRKDLVWDFDDHGHPIQVNSERAHRIADVIASALTIYLSDDRQDSHHEQVAAMQRSEARHPPGSDPVRVP